MLEQTAKKIDELSGFVAECRRTGSFSGIEKDIILSRLRVLYEQVLGESLQSPSSRDCLGSNKAVNVPEADSLSADEIRGEWTSQPEIPAGATIYEEESASDDNSFEIDTETIISDDTAEYTGDEEVPETENSYTYTILGQAVSAEDRNLILNDLFGGDIRLLMETMAILDRFTELDEALIYIYETFDWTPDSQSALRLIELLTNKLS